MSTEEYLNRLRFQLALAEWEMRRDRLEEVIDMFKAWDEKSAPASHIDATEHLALQSIPGISDALRHLEIALAASNNAVERLSEFSPKKKRGGSK